MEASETCRKSAAAGDAHGRTAHLTQEAISDLVAYLDSL
jgi:hypothetical protein